jgi:phosphopantetheinyl transferase (holo-ACP synthase)
MLVGNDIVDLREAGTPSPRFVARVLAPEERAAARAPADVWRRWSAKEAAFKALARRAPALPFAHRRFVVDVEAGVVRHPEGDVQVAWSALDGEALSCVGWQGPGEVVGATAALDDVEAEAAAVGRSLSPREAAGIVGRPSHGVRMLAKLTICEHLAIEWAEVEVLRPGGAAPQAWWRGARLPGIELSLSHDGRYVACAVALESS